MIVYAEWEGRPTENVLNRGINVVNVRGGQDAGNDSRKSRARVCNRATFRSADTRFFKAFVIIKQTKNIRIPFQYVSRKNRYVFCNIFFY